jgi:hypothetical protein
VEEEEVHQQEADDESDSECLLHVPSLLRRLGPASEPRDTFVRRERGSTPPRARFFTSSQREGAAVQSDPSSSAASLGSRRPAAPATRLTAPVDRWARGDLWARRTFGVHSFSTRSRSRLAQSKLAPMRLVPTG